MIRRMLAGALALGTIIVRGAETPGEITVFSWNTEHYAFERWSPEVRKELERNMFDLIRTANPDIVLIQETYGSFERFKAALPEYRAVLQSACNSLYSRFPIAGNRRLWVDRRAKEPLPMNTPVLEFTELRAGDLTLRVSSFAMFWLPICIYAPAALSPEAMLAWEARPQKYPLTPRPEAIGEALAAMGPLLAERECVPLIIGGDFNSMSHLDWTEANKGAEGHCGRAIAWPVSRAMVAAGFTDSYRAVYPDEVAEQGVTCPVAGCLADRPHPVSRLDYVYSAGGALKPVACETIQGRYHQPFTWRGRRFTMFPSDHAALLVRFAVRQAAPRVHSHGKTNDNMMCHAPVKSFH